LIIIFISSFAYLFGTYDFNSPVNHESNLPEFTASDRILIFAPHPDDESLGTAGVIQKALEKNAQVKVVVVTAGDAMDPSMMDNITQKTNNTNFTGNIGDLRHIETINAMSKLGLNQSNIIFLGYPDTGMKDIFEDNWDPDQPYSNIRGSNTNNQSPYNFSYQKNVSYTGSNVVKNFEQIMADYKPTIIFYPDDDDEHPDHWATSAFVRYVKTDTAYQGKSYKYLVHKGFSWPTPLKYAPTLNLKFPAEVSSDNTNIYTSNLDNSQEKLKEAAVNSHASQIVQMKDLLQSFIRKNEPFSSYVNQIKIQKINQPRMLKYSLPLSSFEDPKTDDKHDFLQQREDISSLGVAYDNKYLYMVLKAKGKINNNLIHNFHARIFNGTNFTRIDIQVEDKNATYLNLSSNSVFTNETPKVEVLDDFMVISIPIAPFNDVKDILVYADVNDQNKNIDITAVRNMIF
jgi:LmbE family N-acetylglucosaminyl deacetylase